MLKDWLLNIVATIHELKTKNLTWKRDNQEQQSALKQAQVLAENSMISELKKRSSQLKHELSILQTQNNAELLMLKITNNILPRSISLKIQFTVVIHICQKQLLLLFIIMRNIFSMKCGKLPISKKKCAVKFS